MKHQIPEQIPSIPTELEIGTSRHLEDGIGRKLVWHDEFDHPSIDASKWEIETNVHVNNELQDYTASGNASIENGCLVITARHTGTKPYPYTSARLKTEGLFDFKYGHICARIKTPHGDAGIWPGFWLLGDFRKYGWPACGEIDILEVSGKNPSKALCALHYGKSVEKHTCIDHLSPMNPNDFNLYSCIWTPREIGMFINGQKIHTFNTRPFAMRSFRRKFFIILNLAIGGTLAGIPDPDRYPQQMMIDFVRVYQ